MPTKKIKSMLKEINKSKTNFATNYNNYRSKGGGYNALLAGELQRSTREKYGEKYKRQKKKRGLFVHKRRRII